MEERPEAYIVMPFLCVFWKLFYSSIKWGVVWVVATVIARRRTFLVGPNGSRYVAPLNEGNKLEAF
jgi:hypothetical protein